MTSTPIRLAALAVVAVAVSGVLTITAGGGIPEGLFGAVVLFALLVVLDHGIRSWRSARGEHARARDLLGIAPAAAARDAVVAERRRLTDDISAVLRATLVAIHDLARIARARSDPTDGIAAIGRDARQAAGELRRHLGLLREPPIAERPALESPAPAAAPDRADLLIAAAVTTLAVTEAFAYPRIEGVDWGWLSMAFTGLAAVSIIARRSAPAAGAVVVGLAYLAALAFGAPIVGGFWCLATVGGLLWTIGARGGSSWRDGAAAGFLLAAAGTSAWLLDPANAALLVAIMIIALAGGAVTRLAHARARTARGRARRHAREIARATDAALAAERAAFAREIHDIVSHAVGLIAVQAAAAEVSWPANPTAVDRALRVIEDAAAAAIREMDRHAPHTPARTRTTADVEQLIDRIRAAGTPVGVTGLDLVPEHLMDVAYRVVQESLTNVLRHAAGAAATVTVAIGDGDELAIWVADDGPEPDGTAGRGYGLVGLAERIGFAGGRLAIGAGAAGGFEVRVALPLVADPVTT